VILECCACRKRIDLSRAHRPGVDSDDWCSARVGAHGRDFCSMACADAWERDTANDGAVADSYRRGNCSAYAACVAGKMMLDLHPGTRPPFTSCDADCPLRPTATPPVAVPDPAAGGSRR
jgi:hypothetical protein